ncbi:TetR/AcrR family transcriptional regulator [Aestuariicella hydrocarbonica]|uniref:TetR/AcrR family transcriptional regulator n=2 Tax=Pseudomaricurvus hydrocarbonicus TaxID=1470433 RepID=A0A9E5MN93_9GAMM|nr:TetR/AcrR family transcriptional regulator [Aestuariicella hydrocarbonica]
MIETAVKLISDKGVEAVSIAALARAMAVNRTTVYYHFDSREKLIEEVKAWSSQQLASAFEPVKPPQDRAEHIFRFVLENPELLRMWVDDALNDGDIRRLYPHWDKMVEGMREKFSLEGDPDGIDPEVFSINLLTMAFIGPSIFKSSVCPDADNELVIQRFRKETMRMLENRSFFGEE